MFESKTFTYEKIFKMIRTEVESYKSVSDDILLLACNVELRQLYSQVIKKQVMTTGYISDAEAGKAKAITLETDIPFEDVVLVRCNGETFMHTSPKDAGAYNNTYHEGEDGTINVVMNKDFAGNVEIYYNYRPAEVDGVTSKVNVELPTEYIPMLMAAIRTEAYKQVNEDALSAKWANDYNTYRESFDAWVESTRPQFG
ncbi:MAG: hypothetical protein IJ297_03120 [Clostridia bacterium]|nr:hypothetical protein [Clostridia bacterium]